MKRIITGLIGGVVFISFLFLGGLYLEIGSGVLTTIALSEFFQMRQLKFLSFEGILSTFAALSLVFLSLRPFLGGEQDIPFLLFAFFVFLMLAVMVFSNGKYKFEDAAFPFLAAFYVGFGFQNLILARDKSFLVALFAVFIVWATDIGAYAIGRRFGKHKLLAQISPSKTIEGSVGGIISAVIVAGVLRLLFPAQLTVPLLQLLVLSAIFSAVSQLGDLIESAIKRQQGVKDSGNLLPGHGGILDRFDSMILVLPVMHLMGLF